MANEEILEEDEIVVLPLDDENGQTSYFGYLDSVEFNGKEYLVTRPVTLDEACEAIIEESSETVIFEVEPIDEERENYHAVLDEDLLNTIFGIFKERNKDAYTFMD